MRPAMLAWAGSMLLWLAACANDPDELLRYSGVVLTADQTGPLQGQTVDLFRSSDSICTEGEPYQQVTSDADGGWAVQLYRGELELPTQSRSGRCVEWAATFASGARTRLSFTRIFSVARLPPLFEWSAGFALDGGVLQFDPLETPDRLAELDSQSVFSGVGVTHEVTLSAQGQTVLHTSDVVPPAPMQAAAVLRAPIALPDWITEDFDARLTAVAQEAQSVDATTSSLAGEGGAPVIVAHVPSAKLELKGTRVPVSRGAACPPLADPCVLTDGQLAPVSLSGTGFGGSIELKLTRPAVVDRVVMRESLVTGSPSELRGGAARRQRRAPLHRQRPARADRRLALLPHRRHPPPQAAGAHAGPRPRSCPS